MSFYEADCSNCGYKSNEFYVGGFGKSPGFYYPVACISTKKIFSIYHFSGKTFNNENFDCLENDKIDYWSEADKGKKGKECPNCREKKLKMILTRSIKY